MHSKERERRKGIRERYAQRGLDGINELEALDLLIMHAVDGTASEATARALFKRFGGIREAIEGSQEILKSKGASVAVLLKAVKFAANAYLKEVTAGGREVSSLKEAARIVQASLPARGSEGVYAIFMNARNELISFEPVYSGRYDRRTLQRAAVEKAIGRHASSAVFVIAADGLLARPEHPQTCRVIKALITASSAIDLTVHDFILASKDRLESVKEGIWNDPEREGVPLAAEP